VCPTGQYSPSKNQVDFGNNDGGKYKGSTDYVAIRKASSWYASWQWPCQLDEPDNQHLFQTRGTCGTDQTIRCCEGTRCREDNCKFLANIDLMPIASKCLLGITPKSFPPAVVLTCKRQLIIWNTYSGDNKTGFWYRRRTVSGKRTTDSSNTTLNELGG